MRQYQEPFECPECGQSDRQPEIFALAKERDELRAENEKARAALETQAAETLKSLQHAWRERDADRNAGFRDGVEAATAPVAKLIQHVKFKAIMRPPNDVVHVVAEMLEALEKEVKALAPPAQKQGGQADG